MCLQDYQLARSTNRIIHQFNLGGGSTNNILPSNPSRIGLYVQGPNTGSITLRIGGTTVQFNSGQILAAATVNLRRFFLVDIGSIITEAISVDTSAAVQFNLIEYELPLDPESLKRLAATGKW